MFICIVHVDWEIQFDTIINHQNIIFYILYIVLQDNIDDLSQNIEHKACYDGVVEQLRIQAKNPVLNPLLVTACGNVMRQQCTKEVKFFFRAFFVS